MNNKISTIYLKHIAILLLIAIFFITDRILKTTALEQAAPIKLISDILSFDFVPNYYIAFSLPISGPLLVIISSLAILMLAAYATRAIAAQKNLLLIAALLLVIAGAVSNLLDRLTVGYVIDYLYLRYFTVFNLADIGISAGAILILISINKKSGR